MSAPIRILLVDDQALFRESLALLLDAQPDLQVVGEAANGEAALGGTLRLVPRLERGTEFVVEIPLEAPTWA